MSFPKVIAAALAVAVASAAPGWAQEIAVWDAPLAPDMLAAQPAEVARLLSEQGYQVKSLSTDDLLDSAQLTPDAVSLLVIPTVGVYPSQGVATLEEYLKRGGALVSLGGIPFDRPLARSEGRWQLASIPETAPGKVKVIANFEDVVPKLIRLSGGAMGERMWWETVADEAGEGKCLQLRLDDLAQYEYVGFDMKATGDATYTMLHFRARGDDSTPLLGLEMNEADGSRWKMVLPLSTKWRDYNVFIPQFLSYATEDRGGPGDYLHPERLTNLLLGFTRGMVGGGPHMLYLDDIERWQFVPPDRDALVLPRSIVNATTAAYGKLVRAPEDQAPALLRLFETTGRFEGASLRGTGEGGICPLEVSVPGAYDGWVLRVAEDDGPAYRNVAMSKNRIARVAPVLEARKDDRDLGAAAAVVIAHDGELAGASCASFALANTNLLAEPALKDTVLRTVDYLMRRPRIIKLSPTFGVVEGKAEMTLTATIAAPKLDVGAVEIELRVESLDGATTLARGGSEAPQPAGPTTETTLVVAADKFDPAHYRAVAEVSRADGAVDREVLTVDTTAVMTRLCDFFVAAQQEDGSISGAGCVDQRAARGLLAMFEMTGNEAYRDAAIRWGDMEIREQREDGGYRMGYGITEAGEACYVADGGEIAIGMERLIKYVPADRRQAYLDSLRRYFEYREDFRLQDGSIAVGWVFSKRYTQEGGDERSETPIRSDKSFGFVVGCTLAAGAGLPHITGRAQDREMAMRDAQWFLDNKLKATSVFGEAAQWAHYFLDDEAIRAALAERMKDTLLPSAAKPNGWWYAAGGRSGVTLGALQYYHTQIEASPEARAAIMRGLYYTVADKSPSGLLKVIAKGSPNADEWKYLCYSSISLAEVLQPLVTMQDIAGG